MATPIMDPKYRTIDRASTAAAQTVDENAGPVYKYEVSDATVGHTPPGWDSPITPEHVARSKKARALTARLYGPSSSQPAAPSAPRSNGLMPKSATTPAPAAPTPPPRRTRTPVAAPAAPTTTAADRLNTLLEADSPYIQRARTRAAQAANRRGLLNSSIAAGAGEAAAIDAALPIVQMMTQEIMQTRGLDHDAAQREADRELSELMQERDHEVRQLMQQRGFSHDAAQRQADRSFQMKLRDRTEKFAAEQAQIDRDLQRQLANDAAVRDINAEYQRSLTIIENNPNIPIERRTELQDHYAHIRDQSIRATAQLNDYVPTWSESLRRPEEEPAAEAA